MFFMLLFIIASLTFSFMVSVFFSRGKSVHTLLYNLYDTTPHRLLNRQEVLAACYMLASPVRIISGASRLITTHRSAFYSVVIRAYDTHWMKKAIDFPYS